MTRSQLAKKCAKYRLFAAVAKRFEVSRATVRRGVMLHGTQRYVDAAYEEVAAYEAREEARKVTAAGRAGR